MNPIIALTAKDLKLLLRDKAGFFFTFFFPVLMAVFFGSIFSGQSGPASAMKIFLVDEDGTSEAREFAEKLSQAPELDVLDASRQEAVEGVRRGRRVAYILFPAGFGEASPFAGKAPTVQLGVDPSRSAEKGMLAGLLNKYAAERLSATLADPAKMQTSVDKSKSEIESAPIPDEPKNTLLAFLEQLSKLSEISGSPQAQEMGFGGFVPVQIEEAPVQIERVGPRNPYEISFPQGIIWAILGCSASFAISLVIERTRGTLVRLQMSPLGRGSILAGKALACFLTSCLLAVFLMLLGWVVFKVSFDSVPKLALAIVSVSICFVGLMMFLSVLAPTEQSAGIGWAVLLVMAMLGGGMIPLFIMPGWMQQVSHVSPVKWSILALEGAIWRGFSYQELLLPCVILVAVGAGTFLLGVRAFRWLDA